MDARPLIPGLAAAAFLLDLSGCSACDPAAGPNTIDV